MCAEISRNHPTSNPNSDSEERARERESERARDATSAAAWLLCPGTTCRFGARAASTAAVEYDATTSTDDAANAGVVGGNGWRRRWW